MARQLTNEDIKRAISVSIPIVIKTHAITHDAEKYIEEILEKFLEELGYKNLFNAVSYCVRELLINANKANTKRVYFIDKKLDINNEEQYQTGMAHFKDDTLSNIDYYFTKHKEQGYYTKIVFHTKDKFFKISIHNNITITKKEQIRIFDRIARARAFESISEAFSLVLDQSEGAGLGIVVLILMLKKIGLTEDAFEIDVENDETVARINVPLSDVHSEQLDMLTQAVVNEINTLPRFPENLVYLQKLISDPEAKINQIAKQVQTDPVLIAELLKLVNSPIYRVARKIDNIEESIKLVGMKGLRNLLYSYGTQKILGKKYTQMRELWDHANKVALYSFSIAKFIIRKIKILEDAFVGGILHDLGKIVISSLHPDLLDKIAGFCREKGIPINKMEDLSVGLNHAETGAMIAAKWNFPEQLVAAIRFHHEPSETDPAHIDIVNAVYMANFICDIDDNKITIDQMAPTVKKFFNITSDDDFTAFAQNIKRLSEPDQN